MATLKLVLQADTNNPNVGDLYLDGSPITVGGQTVYTGSVRLTQSLSEEVAQLIWTRLRMFLGEWFLDTAAGVPYFQVVLGKAPISVVSSIFRRAITTCPGVESLVSFSVTRLPARTISVEFACRLADGTTLKSSDFGAFVLGGT